MGLRPPRVAVVFDGGERWHYWARLALYVCTKVWGGEGFILIPHHDGEVSPALLAAARAYDPDYVVRLEPTIRTAEQAEPGALDFVDHDGNRLEGAQRDQLIAQYGDQPVQPRSRDVNARNQLASVCSPHRRRFAGRTEDWDEEVTTLAIDGEDLRLAKLSDLPNVPTGACLSAPPDWGGPVGVAVAARCGVLEEPQQGTEHDMEGAPRRDLVTWLLTSYATPPTDLVSPADARTDIDLTSIGTAFDRTKHGLVTIGRGFRPRLRASLVVGDEVEDFALAYAHRRLYGHGVWLPLSWWAPGGATDPVVSFAIRSEASRYVLRSGEITVTTTSVDAGTINSILTELRQPVTRGSHEERTSELYEKNIRSAAVDRSTKVVQYLAVDGQYDQDFAIPIVRSDTDDIEMQVKCPPPAINHPDLAACTGLRWQVDVELVEAVTPRGRGLDGHALFADDQSLYLTWMRSGRDGVAFESERFDFILAGTPPIARLARPRLRMPGLPTWADLMAAQDGMSTRLSPAGRRVEVMRTLVGDRASLTGMLAGPMLPALRAFRPTAEKRTSESGAVVLRTGSDDHPYETYLTFESIFTLVGDDRDATEVRRQVDEMLKCGILRRGVILGCARCGKPAFVAVDDLAQVNRCPRCSAANVLSQERWKDPVAEPRWYYDLHPTTREHLSQNGEVPLLLSHHLRSMSRRYVDAPELELVDAEGNKLAEADLIALADSELIVAEAKKSGSMGAGKELRRTFAKRALLAEQLRADQIVIATADPGWEQASIEALRTEINNKPWQILAPRARVISGLGTGKVEDLVVDAETGNVSPWAPAKP